MNIREEGVIRRFVACVFETYATTRQERLAHLRGTIARDEHSRLECLYDRHEAVGRRAIIEHHIAATSAGNPHHRDDLAHTARQQNRYVLPHSTFSSQTGSNSTGLLVELRKRYRPCTIIESDLVRIQVCRSLQPIDYVGRFRFHFPHVIVSLHYAHHTFMLCVEISSA